MSVCLIVSLFVVGLRVLLLFCWLGCLSVCFLGWLFLFVLGVGVMPDS